MMAARVIPTHLPAPLATTAQLCAAFQVSRSTFWRWSKTPGFPAAVRFGRSVRWPIAEIEAFLTQQSEA